MTTYYVATLVHYVLVEAPDEATARALAVPGLEALRSPTNTFPVQVRTVRPATEDEIELMAFDARMRAGG
jgi:hypothetical protein